MKLKRSILAIRRRDLILGMAAGTFASAFPSLLSSLSAQANPAENGWRKAVEALTKGARPAPGKISLQFPDNAVDGALVPCTVSVDSPMMDLDYVKSAHLFSTMNTVPEIASFYFSPLSGKAEVSTRIRLGGSQIVVAIAEMSDGKVYMAEREVNLLVRP